MSAPQILGVLGSLFILVTLFEMLRRHRLREKYALTWFLLAVVALAVGIFPGLLSAASRTLGVAVPANLLFFLAALVLLALTLQHSFELGRSEDRIRTLAEEIALLRVELSVRRDDESTRVPPPEDPDGRPAP